MKESQPHQTTQPAATKQGELTFIQAGPLTLVQDCGRRRCQHLGVSVSGAMDQHAFHWANRLLRNPLETAVFEITLGPVTIQWRHPTRVAITGAATHITLNGQPVLPWSSTRVAANASLHIAAPGHGLRTYLAIDGGIDMPSLFQSQAQTLRENLPAPFGTSVKKGDQFFYATKNTTQLAAPNLLAPHYVQPAYNKPLLARVRPCYQYNQFSDSARQTFTGSSFEVSPLSNRMGYQLSGPRIESPAELPWSEGIALGSIQIPRNGQPIILLQDRQSIGGYPKIGTILAEDCNALSQRRPGQQIRFCFVEA